ncbi:hypothetical protein CBL_04432 [Carabus blaptoides fortunei]
MDRVDQRMDRMMENVDQKMDLKMDQQAQGTVHKTAQEMDLMTDRVDQRMDPMMENADQKMDLKTAQEMDFVTDHVDQRMDLMMALADQKTVQTIVTDPEDQKTSSHTIKHPTIVKNFSSTDMKKSVFEDVRSETVVDYKTFTDVTDFTDVRRNEVTDVKHYTDVVDRVFVDETSVVDIKKINEVKNFTNIERIIDERVGPHGRHPHGSKPKEQCICEMCTCGRHTCPHKPEDHLHLEGPFTGERKYQHPPLQGEREFTGTNKSEFIDYSTVERTTIVKKRQDNLTVEGDMTFDTSTTVDYTQKTAPVEPHRRRTFTKDDVDKFYSTENTETTTTTQDVYKTFDNTDVRQTVAQVKGGLCA